MSRALSVLVRCSVCGKKVRGYLRLRGLGVDLARQHTNESTGRTCWGFHRHDHRQVG